MIITLIISIIIEISQLVDIVLTEYAINRNLIEEGNRLFKKKKVRYYIGNSLKIGLPICWYCMFCLFYRYIITRKAIFICLIIVCMLMLIVLIYNSILIMSEKKRKETEDKIHKKNGKYIYEY